MTELLALKKKTSVDMMFASIPRPAPGIPINALPGWAEVPLFNKLPMLKCPTNQIIFSKNKIGQEIIRLVGAAFRIYDPYMQLLPSAYNSLDDKHLRKYYQKESVLKHLRDIKKISANNDVLCTLRDFNSFRLMLQEYHLGLIHREIKKREGEQQDRALLFHAESIAAQECRKFAKQRRRDLKDVLRQKQERAKRHQEKLAAMLKKFKSSIDRIEKIKEIRKRLLAQKTFLYNLIIQQHKLAALNLLRKRIIIFKKQFADREKRLNRFRREMTIQKLEAAKQKATKRWEMVLAARQRQHQRNNKLLKEAEERTQRNIKRRRKKLEKQWRRIQEAIAKRAKQHKSLKPKKKKKKIRKTKSTVECKDSEMLKMEKSVKFSSPIQNEKYLSKLLIRKNIPDVVNIALDIEEKIKKMEDDPDNTVKVAEYILDVVIKSFKTDLSKKTETMVSLSRRIAALFQKLKTVQIVKVNSILKDSRKNSRDSGMLKHFDRSVSFGLSTSIGSSLQQIRSDIEIKRVRSRDPTPAGSLEALAPAVYARHSDETDDTEKSSERKSMFSHCSKEERIFIEHFYIKFRRALIVGVSRRIFEAVGCYKNNHILNPRKELLDIDRQYLVTTMARSILCYAVNNYNFESNLKLCINALSADIIYHLQQGLLKPSFDIRYLRQPKCRCNYSCSGLRY